MLTVINPGHSASDPGAIGPTRLMEAEVNLRVAHALLPRTGNGLIYRGQRQPPGKRGLGIMLLALKTARPDLVLSIHCNGHEWRPGKCIHRAEAFYWVQDPDRTRRERSLAFAEHLAATATGEPGYAETAMLKTFPVLRKRADGSTYWLTPGVMRYGVRAAAMIELGYVSDPHVEAAMRTIEWVRKAAAALDRALREFADTITRA